MVFQGVMRLNSTGIANELIKCMRICPPVLCSIPGRVIDKDVNWKFGVYFIFFAKEGASDRFSYRTTPSYSKFVVAFNLENYIIYVRYASCGRRDVGDPVSRVTHWRCVRASKNRHFSKEEESFVPVFTVFRCQIWVTRNQVMSSWPIS
jgi:hypothetical protein